MMPEFSTAIVVSANALTAQGIRLVSLTAISWSADAAGVELKWERFIGLYGRFVGIHSFGASGKIADAYKKFDINPEAVVRAAQETLAEVAAL
jgi:transketolase